MKREITKEYANKLIDRANRLIGFDYYENITTEAPNKRNLSKIIKHLEGVIAKLERGING